MLDSKTMEKLTKLRNLYSNNAAFGGEKENAKKLIHNICKKHGINSEQFIKYGFKNTGHKTAQTGPKNKKNNTHSDYDYNWSAWSPGGGGEHYSYDAYRYRKKAQEQKTETEADHNIPDIIYEIKHVVVTKVVSASGSVGYKLQTLSRQDLGSDRWGTQNFIYYPNYTTFDVEEYFDLPNDPHRVFRVYCRNKKYYDDHILIRSLYKVKRDGALERAK